MFHLFVPPSGYFTAIFCSTESFTSTYPITDETTDATPSPRLPGIPGSLGTRTIRCVQRSFFHHFPPWPPILFGRISWSCTFA